MSAHLPDPVRVVAPAETPVSLAEVKAALSVDHEEHDPWISTLIGAVTERLDGWGGILGRAIVTQEWAQSYPGWGVRMPLPLEASALEGIDYVAADHTEQTLPVDGWRIVTRGVSEAVAPEGLITPALAARQDAVTLRFSAGSAASAVPVQIKAAIIKAVGDVYDARGDEPEGGAMRAALLEAAHIAAGARRIWI